MSTASIHLPKSLVSAASPAIPTLFFAAIAFLYLAYKWALPKPIPGIPYNEKAGKRLAGDMPEMLSHIKQHDNLFPWIISHNRTHQSPITQLFPAPLSKPWVVLSDFKESQDILLHRTKEFDRGSFFGSLFSGIIPEHHIHKKSADPAFKGNRALLKDLMTPQFLNNVAAPNMHGVIEELVKLWMLKAELADGRPFEAGKDIYYAFLDNIIAAAFGLDARNGTVHSQRKVLKKDRSVSKANNVDPTAEFPPAPLPTDFEALIDLTESFDTMLKSPFPQLAWLYLRYLDPKVRKAYHIKERMLEGYLDEGVRRLAAGESEKTSAMDDVLQREQALAGKEGRVPNFFSRTIKDELFGFLLGGHDTTATTMSWAIKRLTDHPQVQTRLRKEFREAFPAALAEGRNPSADEIATSHIQYLEAFIEENVRTSGTAAGVTRIAMQDTTVLGYAIPKGTEVFLLGNGPGFLDPGFKVDDAKRHPSALAEKGRQVGVWDESTMGDFLPERWLVTDPDTGMETYDSMAGPHLGFGLGPRGCFGRRLAYLSMRIVVVLLLWNLELQKCPEELSDYDRVEKLTSMPKRCYLRARKVEKAWTTETT